MVKYKQIMLYEEKLKHWHISFKDDCDIEKLKNLIKECMDTINLCKGNSYLCIIQSLENQTISRNELEMFTEKLDYYGENLKILKLKLAYHIVSFNFKYKNINVLREDFDKIYTQIMKRGRISKLYIITHPKYRYILEGVVSDLRHINGIKQGKYIKIYMEMLWFTQEVNRLWRQNSELYKLSYIHFDVENVNEELEKQRYILHRIIDMHSNYMSINRLLKRNTCFYPLNPYSEITYIKLMEVVKYLILYQEYLWEKISVSDEIMLENSVENDIILSEAQL